jgi:ATP-dependent RNA helicase DeaD
VILFSEMGLRKELQEAIADLGFTSPTPIQEQTIPLLTENTTDLVALAQTGTGKTAAFGLPLLHTIDEGRFNPQVLILCPTRELCLQITRDLQSFSTKMPEINIVAIYGGSAITTQIRAIRSGAQIVVATPGRLKDMIERKAIKLSEVETVVLDEADEMLNMGFRDDIDFILATTPTEKQTWLFSATMPPEVAAISKNYMLEPVEISIGKKNASAANIRHVYYQVAASQRYEALKRIADFHPDIYGIIFCRTKVETQDIAEKLIRDGYNADSLHGDLSQAQRDAVMRKFRSKHLQMLVATDVAARGIDVDNISHVINYNLPDDIESYTHRSGRTARAGKFGISLAIITAKDVTKIRQIERKINAQFEKLPVPGGIEVCEQQLLNLTNKAHDVDVNPDIEQFLPAIIERFTDLDKEEVIRRFVSLEFNRFLEYYKNAPDLNAKASREPGVEGASRRPEGLPMKRFFVGVGEMDGVDKSGMVRLICDTTGLPNARIGKIDLRRSFSFFEVPEQYAHIVLDKFRDVYVNDRPIKIEVTEEGGYPRDKKGKPYEGKGGFGSRGSQGGKYGNQGSKYGQGDGGSRRDRFSQSGKGGGFHFGGGKSKSGDYDRPARRRD